jgi:CRP/FNR family cyclic AMP-dependent transcriptional regulator
MDYVNLMGWIAALLTLATFSMKTMIPLRLSAIFSNLSFITYGTFAEIYPVVALHCALLPFNLFRLHQMRRLISKARTASRSEFSLDWIKPYMFEKTYRAGDTIFQKGDSPDLLYYLESGRVHLKEIDVYVEPGNIFGEIAFFAPDRGRTGTAAAEDDARVYCIDEASLKQLYFQNPSFGYFLMNLVARRLSENVTRLERGNVR